MNYKKESSTKYINNIASQNVYAYVYWLLLFVCRRSLLVYFDCLTQKDMDFTLKNALFDSLRKSTFLDHC